MRGAAGRPILLFFVILAPTAGCSNKAQPGAAPSASAMASQRPAATPLPAKVQPPTPPGCRAMKVSGSVALEGGGPLVSGALVDGSAWLELPDKSEVWLKHPPSGRELNVFGPARVLACRAGREELLLASGKVTTSTGAGVRPGAEVLIATPEAALRYGNAELVAISRDGKLALEVRAGETWVEAADPAAKLKTNPVRPKGRLSLRGKLGAEALLERCHVLAEAAAESARQVLSRTADSGSPGERAATQVRDRRSARAACSIAAAATGLVADPGERQRLRGLLERWDQVWQAVPRAPK